MRLGATACRDRRSAHVPHSRLVCLSYGAGCARTPSHSERVGVAASVGMGASVEAERRDEKNVASERRGGEKRVEGSLGETRRALGRGVGTRVRRSRGGGRRGELRCRAMPLN